MVIYVTADVKNANIYYARLKYGQCLLVELLFGYADQMRKGTVYHPNRRLFHFVNELYLSICMNCYTYDFNMWRYYT